MASSKKLILKSSDGETFEIYEKVAFLSGTLKNMIEDVNSNAITLPNVTGKTLSKVIEFCNKHAGKSETEAISDELKQWDKAFVAVDQNTLFDYILAANFLEINGLLDVTCEAVAHIIKDFSPQQVRKYFNIENDFTPAEEAQFRRDNAWAFE